MGILKKNTLLQNVVTVRLGTHIKRSGNLMDFYQICCECEKRFLPMDSVGFADNKCGDCSEHKVFQSMNVLSDTYVPMQKLRRSKSVSHKEPERRDESPPPGQEDEHHLERHPNTAGLPGPTDTVDLTEEGLEVLAEEQEPSLPPEAPEADAL